VTTLASLKPAENMLDGLICAWIGIEQLSDRTFCLENYMDTIWIPKEVKTREAV